MWPPSVGKDLPVRGWGLAEKVSVGWVLSSVLINHVPRRALPPELGLEGTGRLAAPVCSMGRCGGECRGEVVNWRQVEPSLCYCSFFFRIRAEVGFSLCLLPLVPQTSVSVASATPGTSPGACPFLDIIHSCGFSWPDNSFPTPEGLP